jgi:hypothetical protein
MILTLHILIALASVAFATYVLFNPSRAGLRANYTLVAATIATGTFMVATQPVHMLQACLSGLLYTGFVGIALLAASRRLAASMVRAKNNRIK